MKLLGWMHRKIYQNGTEHFMNFSRGNPTSCFSAKASIDEQLHHTESTFSFTQTMQPNRKCQRFSNEVKINNTEEASKNESSYEVFHGFLAIGTLGSESLDTEPSTPTFPVSFQNGIEKEKDVTENDLQLINTELEKFLEAEAKGIDDDSSARSSYASIITITNKQFDDADTEGWRYSVTCPLQKYLFGSSIEVPETVVMEKKEKTSLEDLFKRNDNVHKNNEEKYDSAEKQAKGSNATQFMKKVLKKLQLTARNSATASNTKTVVSTTTKNKLPKVLQVFHRKVYPEGQLAEQQFDIAGKADNKSPPGETRARDKVSRGKKRSPEMANLNKETSPSELFSRRVKSNATEANREHWIKTDAEYLVLEL